MHQAWLASVDDTCDDLEPRYPKLRLEESGHAISSAAKQSKNCTALANAIPDLFLPT